MEILDIIQTYRIELLIALLIISVIIVAVQISRIAKHTHIIMINTKNQDLHLTKIEESTDRTNGILSEIQTQYGHNNDSWGIRPQ